MAEINVSVTHILLVMGSDVMRLPGRNQCHSDSLAVGHGMGLSWLVGRNEDTVTHSLFIMGLDMVRLLARQNHDGMPHSLLVIDETPARRKGNATYNLIDMVRCDEKNGTVTHKLLVEE